MRIFYHLWSKFSNFDISLSPDHWILPKCDDNNGDDLSFDLSSPYCHLDYRIYLASSARRKRCLVSIYKPKMTLKPRDEPKFLYLPKNQWSPRFEDSFYTVRVEGFERWDSSPPGVMAVGHAHHPAFYYKVVLHRGQEKHELWRRFSQFQWLHHQVTALPPPPVDGAPPPVDPIRLPPGTCWPFQSDELATKRVDLLSSFLDDMLSRPGYASHGAVLTFLGIKQQQQQQQQQQLEKS